MSSSLNPLLSCSLLSWKLKWLWLFALHSEAVWWSFQGQRADWIYVFTFGQSRSSEAFPQCSWAGTVSSWMYLEPYCRSLVTTHFLRILLRVFIRMWNLSFQIFWAVFCKFVYCFELHLAPSISAHLQFLFSRMDFCSFLVPLSSRGLVLRVPQCGLPTLDLKVWEFYHLLLL